MAEVDNSLLKIIPAPTGGWNTRDPLHAMPENDAIELIDYYPDTSAVVLRGGIEELSEAPAPNDNIHQIFTGPTSDPRNEYDQLYVAAAVGAGVPTLYRVDLNVSPITWTACTGAATLGTSRNPYQCIWQNYLYVFEYGTAAWKIGMTGNAAQAVAAPAPPIAGTFTGFAVPEYVVQAAPYKNRLYFVEEFQPAIYYSDLNATSGAVNTFLTAGAFTQGGLPWAVAGLTEHGASVQEVFCAVSHRGELVLFQGDYPGSATWSIIGRYDVSEPLGRNCFFYVDGKLHLMTVDGLHSVNDVIAASRTNTPYVPLSDKIQSAWDEMVVAGKAYKRANIWKPIHAPYHKKMLIIKPTTGFNYWLVYNVGTRAWTKFTIPSDSMVVSLNDKVILDNFLGAGNKIWELKKPDTSGNKDFGSVWTASGRTAFSYLNELSHNKHILSVKPFFELYRDVGLGLSIIDVDLGVDYDFADRDQFTDVLISGTTDGSNYYSRPVDARAEGTAFSVIFRSDFSGGYRIKWNLFIVNYELGGFLS